MRETESDLSILSNNHSCGLASRNIHNNCEPGEIKLFNKSQFSYFIWIFYVYWNARTFPSLTLSAKITLDGATCAIVFVLSHISCNAKHKSYIRCCNSCCYFRFYSTYLFSKKLHNLDLSFIKWKKTTLSNKSCLKIVI